MASVFASSRFSRKYFSVLRSPANIPRPRSSFALAGCGAASVLGFRGEGRCGVTVTRKWQPINSALWRSISSQVPSVTCAAFAPSFGGYSWSLFPAKQGKSPASSGNATVATVRPGQTPRLFRAKPLALADMLDVGGLQATHSSHFGIHWRGGLPVRTRQVCLLSGSAKLCRPHEWPDSGAGGCLNGRGR